MRLELPAAHAPHIHVDEVGSAIVTDSSTMQAQRGITHRYGWNPRQPKIDRFSLHVKAVTGYARMCVSRTQKLVAPGRAVSADNVDLSIGIVD